MRRTGGSSSPRPRERPTSPPRPRARLTSPPRSCARLTSVLHAPARATQSCHKHARKSSRSRADPRRASPYGRVVPEIPPRQLVVCGLALVAVLLVGGWYLARDGRGAGPSMPAPAIRVQSDGGSGGEGGSNVVVHVAGAVRDPGVYRLRAGARVDDAVGRAGGATSKADLSQVNLAAKVEDGRQVLVPQRVPAGQVTAGGGPA